MFPTQFLFIDGYPITNPPPPKQKRLRKQHALRHYHRQVRQRRQELFNSTSQTQQRRLLPGILGIENTTGPSHSVQEHCEKLNNLKGEKSMGRGKNCIETVLGAGRLDPFDVYPLQNLPIRVHEILDHG